MISVNNLKVEFGVKPLLSDVSFAISDKEHVALVGKNGAGKSTLLKIMAGLQKSTSGNVSVPTGQTVGYLPQTMKIVDSRTIKEEVALAFDNIKDLKEVIERLGNQLASRTDYESEEYTQLIDKLSHATERLNMLGGQNYEAELERTLTGLGFERKDFGRPTKELSGGWRMRIELAKLLLRKPDILLLDEPTNHLDIWSIEWLEKFLSQSPSSIVLVSHDRAFINNITNRTLEIECGKLIDYKVKYDDYVTLRAERREAQLRAYENQQKEIADIKEFIERFRYKPTKAVQVQSRIKQLEKIVPIEVDEVDNSCLHLKFPPCNRSGDYPVICDDVRKDYGAHTVFDHVTFTIKRGEKVAFVGKNGEGKSTLVKCIMNQIPFTGELKIGHNVEIGYFAQNEAQLLDDNVTVFETIDNVAKGDIRTKIRDILGAFMFGGEASDKYVKVLSGGERSRLAMLRLLLQPFNMLILDEPTNHLDMRTKKVLKEAISNFDGTAIIVSHDRSFLDGLVSKVYEFGGGKVIEHLGGIYDFLNAKEVSSFQELERTQASNVARNTLETSEKANSQGVLDWAAQKELRRKEQKLKRQIKECENSIEELEASIHILEDKMNTPEGASDLTIIEQHARLSRQLENTMDEWTLASEELEQLNTLQ
ncbi:MAG: ABC-F family ATP-binding cassette domain-containing protein [Bacteroidaceae bacterium]|nr:ABC-F family ATP-binding cassette domain-containing protein [Bacteroidaceae bacterium]